MSRKDYRALGGPNSLTFNNSQVTIDPGGYSGSYFVENGNVLPQTTGASVATVVPGMDNYTLKLEGLGYIDFNVDAAGTVTSQHSDAAVGIDTDGDQVNETLRFNNVQVTIDPGGYAGDYHVENGDLLPNTTGAASFVVVPGMDNYTITVPGAGNYDFDVDANGDPVPPSIDVDVSGEIYTFDLNSGALISIDPGAYVGEYYVASQDYVSGLSTITLDEGTYNATLRGIGSFGFSVDAAGNVTSQNTDAATGGPSSLTFKNVTVTIDPGDYEGQYYVGGGVSSDYVVGAHDVVLVPSMQSYDLYFDSIAPRPVTFDVDAVGNVTSNHPDAMEGSFERLAFKNVIVTIDPGTYDGRYYVGGGVLDDYVVGAHDVVLVPAMQSYDLYFHSITPRPVTFDVAADGSVTSNHPDAMEGSFERLSFKNVTITIDPGGYAGEYYVEGGDLLPNTTGAASFVVVPGMDDYTITVPGAGNYDFNVDAGGDPVPSTIDVDVSPGETYTFLLSQVDYVTIDPGEYGGEYRILGGPSGFFSGPADFELDEGSYILDFHAIGSFNFTVDAAGFVSTTSEAAHAVGHTLVFNSRTIHVEPGAYAGEYRVLYTDVLLAPGPRDIVLVGGLQADYKLNLYAIGTFTFAVDADGNVSTTSDAAQGVGDSLIFNTRTIHVDPNGYAGDYRVTHAGVPIAAGVRDIALVGGLQSDYKLNFYAVDTFTFAVDAAGNVSTTSAAAQGFGDTLVFNSATIRIDPGGYNGVYRLTHAGVPDGAGVRDVVLVGGFQPDYDLTLTGIGSFNFTVDANGQPDPSSIPVDVSGEIYTFLLSQVTNAPPIALVGGPYTGVEGSAVVFHASGSSDPDDDPLQYRWDFNGDGGWDTEYATDPTADYTWSDDYSGLVTVEVYDGEYSDTATAAVTVNNVAPTLTVATTAVVIDEGSSASKSITTDDVPADTVSVAASIGVISGSGDNWSWSYDGVDDLVTTLVTITATDEDGGVTTATFDLTVNNVAPSLDDAVFTIEENSPNGTAVGSVTGTDPGDDALTYSIVRGSGETAFAINPNTGAITVDDATQLDFEATPSLIVEVQVSDDDGGIGTAQVTIDLLNLASITGVVFVDVNQNGLYEANEPGIDGVIIQLLDESGTAVLDDLGVPVTASTSNGGLYLFEDLEIGTYQLHEIQPSGVDDGPELLGSLGGTIPANDTMQLALDRTDATDYVFAELGQQVANGDTATIGFWHNKHGQALIAQGGPALAQWLTANFDNVFGDEFVDADGADVARFFNEQLFKQVGKKSKGPAKVDAQFMAVALAAYFTSNDLADDVAVGYGFNVTDTGIGTKVVNVGTAGAAFGVADGTGLTIMQLLRATNDLTDLPNDISGFAHIYDTNGDGDTDDFDDETGNWESELRSMANEVYSGINEQGDI